MKKVLLLFAVLTPIMLLAQNVGIGTLTPHSNAALDISSTSKGLLLPRLTDTNAVTGSKPAGLTIYSNSDNQLYYYNGSRWMNSGAATADSIWYLGGDSLVYNNRKYTGIRINPLLQPLQEGLQVSGNLLVQGGLQASNAVPTAGQTLTMDNNPAPQERGLDSVNRILDPGGVSNYTNNNQGNVRIYSLLGAPAGYKVSFNPADFTLGTGDTLWISRASYALGGNLNYLYRYTESTTAPADLFIPHFGTGFNSIFFLFRSNGDGQNGAGFDITIRKIYAASSPAAEPPPYVGAALYFNPERAALSSGLRRDDRQPGYYSAGIGSGAATGSYSFATGESEATGQYAFAGGSSRARGAYSTAFGNFSTAEGAGSTATGEGSYAGGTGAFAAGATAFAESNYSFAAGLSAQTYGYGSVAIGNNIATAAYSIALGRYNDSLVTRETVFNSGTATSPVLIVGNGDNTFARSNAFTILKNGNTGIGNMIPQTRLHVKSVSGEAVRIEGPSPYLSFFDGAVFKGYLQAAGTAFEIGSKSSLPVDLYTSDTKRMTILANGNVGIGEPAPTARLQINGFTRLGSTSDAAPAIKMKEINMTSPASDGGIISVPHGLTASKIIAITAILEYAAGGYTTPGSRPSAGYEFSLSFDTAGVYITNMPGNSSNILNKPVKITITYKE